MYICLGCGATFYSPKRITEVHTELEDRAEESFYVCPYCESGWYEETVACENCGTVIGESQGSYGLCPKCEIQAEEKFDSFLSTLSKEEIAYLNNQYDGRYFGE